MSASTVEFSAADAAEIQAIADRDPAPSVQTRTEQAVLRGLLSWVGANSTSSERIPLRHRYEMRADAIIGYAHLLSLASQLQAKYKIVCRNPQKAAGIDAAYRRVHGRLTVQAAEARFFGWQFMVKQFGLMRPGWEYIDRSSGDPVVKKVWDEGDVPMLVWEPFVPLRPETVSPAWDAAGRLGGVRLGVPGPFAFDTVTYLGQDAKPGEQMVPLDYCFWHTNNRDGEWGSIWGSPRTRSVYRFWKAYEAALAVVNTAIARKGDPTWMILFPTGSSMWNGRDTANQVIATTIANQAKSGSVLIMPSEMYDKDESGSGSARKWSIEAVKFEDSIPNLIEAMKYFDVMKFRAMGISELSIAEGSGGTSSRNVAAVTGSKSDTIQYASQLEFDGDVNNYMIPQLSEQDFPELRDEPAEKLTQTFGDDETRLIADLLRSYANKDPELLPMDVRSALESMNIDVEDPRTAVEAEKRMIEQASAAKPQASPAKPGESGVDESGFYYAPREHIQLSTRDGVMLVDDESLLEQLPPTKHYQDGVVIDQMRVIRALWFAQLKAQYEDFASYLGSDDLDASGLELAEGDRKARVKKIVDRIVSAWRFDPEKTKTVVSKTRDALSAIFARAGEVETKTASLSTDDWKPEEKRLARWVSDNAAKLVRGVEKTTRDELRTFLLSEIQDDKRPDQIARDIRSHFSGRPAWRSDLIAREETRRYYNAATLFAAEEVGAGQLQALDARLGEHRSDKDCIDRNGKLYDVDQAWRVEAQEHVRGTLAWRILQTKITLEYFARDPENDVAARCDLEKHVVHLREDLGPEESGDYLLRSVDWLMARA